MSSGPNKRIQRTSNRFSEVPKAQISRSTFNRSHAYKTTFLTDRLIPILVDDVLPGDTFSVKLNAFARIATPLHPTMDNLYLDSFFFFVPNRLVWDNWQRQMGEQTNPGDSTDYLTPLRFVTDVSWNPLDDYFGIPQPAAGQTITVNALPYRSYWLIWNEWFRDQNLQNSRSIPRDDGPDASVYAVEKRNKKHDYFTSSLPWPQKGDSVTMPLGDYAPVTHDASASPAGTGAPTFLTAPQELAGTGLSAVVDGGTGSPVTTGPGPNWAGGQLFWGDTGLVTDLRSVSGATINALRQAFQVQKLLERDARGGTRYTEVIKAHFNVTSPDARLQRPEYLGGGTSFIQINPVAQTNATASDVQQQNTPQGNLTAVGTTAVSGHGFHKSFTEHGFIIGMVCARADLTYQQGVERMWSRRTRLDYFWPALQHIGEQAVLSKELYADGTVGDDDTFAYQERYAEYRYKPSKITGQFRSSDPTSLDSWHYAEDFAARPVLNSSFIEYSTPMDRTVAVPSEPDFLFDAWIEMKCARPMPVYGVPGLIDHF